MTSVSIDVTAIPADPRGAGRYALNLATALARRTDIELHAIARRGDGQRWRDLLAGGDVTEAAPSARPARLAWEQVALPRLLGKLDVAVHHAPHYTMPEAASTARVVTVHDLTFFDHPEWHQRSKVVLFRRAIRVAARHADAVVCVSRATADRLREEVVPEAAVHVIPHGVDHERFTPDADPDADDSALLANGIRRPYVCFIGTIEPRKDVPTLVRAFDRIAGAHPDLQLVLAGGRGWGWKAAAVAIDQVRHGGRIVLPGYIPDDIVPALLRRAACVAYPSLDEGFGLPALEALACGAPLVTSSAAALREVSDGAALLADPGDVDGLAGALDMAVRGDAGLDARRRRGLDVAARHRWDASAAAHAAVYREVAEEPRGRPGRRH